MAPPRKDLLPSAVGATFLPSRLHSRSGRHVRFQFPLQPSAPPTSARSDLARRIPPPCGKSVGGSGKLDPHTRANDFTCDATPVVSVLLQ